MADRAIPLLTRAMSAFRTHQVRCVCGQALAVSLADSVNVGRSPELRRQILGGTLHSTSCPACSRGITIEKSFHYLDPCRDTYMQVHPRGERHLWRQASAVLDESAAVLPEGLIPSRGRTLRVAFGMDELREKLVAQDLGLDDRFVELLKVFLVYEHPVLLRKARLRLTLRGATPDAYEFVAAYEHHPRRFRLGVPLSLAAALGDQAERLAEWVWSALRTGSLWAPEARWVNIWRLSPQPDALDRLREYAERARRGEQIDTDSADFQQMLTYIPTGDHLPAWAKRDLRTLLTYADARQLRSLADRLFEKRFRFELEDEWSQDTEPQNLDSLWDLLDALPDAEVEGNTMIHEVLLDLGTGRSEYDPKTHDIHLGADVVLEPADFAHVLRHEVGHAVRHLLNPAVDTWLEKRFGWRTFARSDAGIDGWVALMGGWGSATDEEQAQARDFLRGLIELGVAQSAGRLTPLPASHPWNADANFGPCLAYKGTEPDWYQHVDKWYRYESRKFFLDYYYGTLVAVDVATLGLIACTLRPVAAMAAPEFFAELYALYRDPNDARRGHLPPDVLDWLDENLAPPDGSP